MNEWTKLSCRFAQQRNYLDELYKVYPIIPNFRREITEKTVVSLKDSFNNRDNKKLVEQLLKLEIFPLKDSYVAFLKKDKTALERNPATIDRIAGNLYDIGFDKIIEKCTEPKETNRQIGPMFKKWIEKGTIGATIIKEPEEFLKSKGNCIFNSSDDVMGNFARNYLGFKREKGIDFLAKFNDKYVIAEAKFITAFGGHQNAQFFDAMETMNSDFSEKTVDNEVIPISIIDGVLYTKGKNKINRFIEKNNDKIIISALILREYLYSL